MTVIEAIEKLTTITELTRDAHVKQQEEIKYLKRRMNCLFAAVVVLGVILFARAVA